VVVVHLQQTANRVVVKCYKQEFRQCTQVLDKEHAFDQEKTWTIDIPGDRTRCTLMLIKRNWVLMQNGTKVKDWLEMDYSIEDEAAQLVISRVEILGHRTEQAEDSASKHVEYELVVTCADGSSRPHMFKRYSDFETLKKHIESAVQGNATLTLPKLPAKTIFKQFSQKYLEQRGQELEAWCARVVNVPRIALNPDSLEFFGLIHTGDHMYPDAVTDVAPVDRDVLPPPPRLLLDRGQAHNAEQLLGGMRPGEESNPKLMSLYSDMDRLSLHIETRRDVALCQGISVVVAAFFATLEAAARESFLPPLNPLRLSKHLQDEEGLRSSLKKCAALRSIRLIERMGFVVVFESLLSTFGNEQGMLEDLDDVVRLLHNSVRLVCKERTDGGRNECVKVEIEEVRDQRCHTNAETEPEPEPEPEPEHGHADYSRQEGEAADETPWTPRSSATDDPNLDSKWRWNVILDLTPECFALLDVQRLSKRAAERARSLREVGASTMRDSQRQRYQNAQSCYAHQIRQRILSGQTWSPGTFPGAESDIGAKQPHLRNTSGGTAIPPQRGVTRTVPITCALFTCATLF
jgi:hypothetical protein